MQSIYQHSKYHIDTIRLVATSHQPVMPPTILMKVSLSTRIDSQHPNRQKGFCSQNIYSLFFLLFEKEASTKILNYTQYYPTDN